jgi:hypothetical protein
MELVKRLEDSYGTKAIPFVVSALRQDALIGNWTFRHTALALLRRIGEPAVPGLIEVMGLHVSGYGDDPFDAGTVLTELGRKAVPALITVLQAERPDPLRSLALHVLERIGPDASAAIEEIRRVGEDSRWTDLAQAALARISPEATHDRVERDQCQETASLLPPGDLHDVRDSLAARILELKSVSNELPARFWNRGPIETIIGSSAVIEAVVSKLEEEERLIAQHVPDIRSLTARVYWYDWLDGVREPKPHDHATIALSRCFRNGGGDVILHHVFRVGESEFRFAYTRL